MLKSVPLFVGLRYVRAKRRNHFISFISLFSIIGIALGVMVLIVVLSVMNGFESEIKKRLLSMESHITLRDFSGDWQQAVKQAKQNPKVIGGAPFIDGFGLINRGYESNGVFIRGINPDRETEVSEIGKHLIYGKLEDLKKTKFGIILGYEIAYNLLGPYELSRVQRNLSIPEEKVMLVVPQLQIGPTGVLPRYKRFKIVGIFKLNMKDYDSNTVLVHINDAAKLFKKKNQVSAIQLKLTNVFLADQVKAELKNRELGWSVSTWYDRHSSLFSAIATEKRVMTLILFILVLVAAINIISTLVMVVTDKEADIAILRTLGASPGAIRNIFMVQGTMIGSIGTLAGVGLGVLIAINVESIISGLEKLIGAQFMSADIYYISRIVGEVHWSEVGIIAISTFLISILATLYPAYKAARTEPAQALRYE